MKKLCLEILQWLHKTGDEIRLLEGTIHAYLDCRPPDEPTIRVIEDDETSELLFAAEPTKNEENSIMAIDTGNGRGTIAKRKRVNKKGSVYYWYEGRVRINGKMHTVTGKTLEECLNRLNGVDSVPKTMFQSEETAIHTFNDILNIWMDKKVSKLAKSTQNSYGTCIRLHIPQSLKDKDPNSIKAYHIEEVLAKISQPRQRDITYIVITAAFRWASKNELCNNKSYEAVEHKKHKSNSRRPLEPHELELLLKTTENNIWLRDNILLYVWTGCRLKELYNTTAEDAIDWEGGFIKIWDQKTKKWKYPPILPPIVDILKSKNGRLVSSAQRFQQELREVCDKIGLNDISCHNLRHTCGSQLEALGVPMKTIQKWLGHNTLKVTEDIYTKKTDASIAKDIKNLIERLKN